MRAAFPPDSKSSACRQTKLLRRTDHHTPFANGPCDMLASVRDYHLRRAGHG